MPQTLARSLSIGSVVSVRLSGRSRIGVITQLSPLDDESATEKVLGVSEDVSLTEPIVRACEEISEKFALSLAVVLRAALPQGMVTDRYEVMAGSGDFGFDTGDIVTRRDLRSSLGDDGLKEAEASGTVILRPGIPAPRMREYARLTGDIGDVPKRAAQQRELLSILLSNQGEMPVRELLDLAGASRQTLRSLAGRGAVRIESRTHMTAIVRSSGTDAPENRDDLDQGIGKGISVARVPTSETFSTLVGFADRILSRGGRVLVLAPEVSYVQKAVEKLSLGLDSGARIGVLHAGVKEWPTVWKAAATGGLDVLVGTRTAALVPLAEIGGIVVLDEPNPSYRAAAGHEGLPVHVRDTVYERVAHEGCGSVFVSPFPSLGLYSRVGSGSAREVEGRWPDPWPKARIVDMRGSGAMLSSVATKLCRDALKDGSRVGVVAPRLGYSTSVVCQSCGTSMTCPECGGGLTSGDRKLTCVSCGKSTGARSECAVCGSSRLSYGGVTVERLREELSESLGTTVGILTAGHAQRADALVVVGTPRAIASVGWDHIIVPDVDTMIADARMGAVERAFRMLYSCAEASRKQVTVQTREPEHYAIRAALRGDYRKFVVSELPRLRSLGYPPFVHIAALTFSGSATPGAVKSIVQNLCRRVGGVTHSEPVMVRGGTRSLRVLLRSENRKLVARAGLLVARHVAKKRSSGMRVAVEVDPEEV